MNGGHWGRLIRADIDPKGNIWVFHRCFNTEPAGYATCVGRTEPPISKIRSRGKTSEQLWQRNVRFPHGFTVDRQGFIWASDANDSETVLGISAKNGVVRGHQVFKMNASGKILMTLEKEGVKKRSRNLRHARRSPSLRTAIFCDRHYGTNDRVVKFSKDGENLSRL